MNVREISDRIDGALDKMGAGLAVDEYFKSLYVTRAQAHVVQTALDSYEYGDALRHVLGKLLVEKELTGADVVFAGDGYINLPLEVDIKQIVFERTNTAIKTIPMDYNDIHDILKSPFREPDTNIAYRVTRDNSFSLYTSEVFAKYFYVYCKIPKAIVLETLPYELAVQGVNAAQGSELPYDTMLRVVDVTAHLLVRDKARFMPKARPEKT